MRILLKAVLVTTLSTVSIGVSNSVLAGPSEDGMRALQAQDFSRAKSAFLLGANQGDVQSQVFLAMMYEKGLGISKSTVRAANWYCKAAKQGHKPSLEKLAVIAPDKVCVNRMPIVKHKTVKHVNDGGKAEALYLQGMDDWRRRGNSKDNKPHYDDKALTARANLSKAAQYGHANAQYQLGEISRLFLDNKTALSWYRMAGEQGHVEAQYELGQLYSLGLGVTKSDADSFEWYRKASHKGHVKSMLEIASYYSMGRGVPLSKQMAITWYKKAAVLGDETAQTILTNAGLKW